MKPKDHKTEIFNFNFADNHLNNLISVRTTIIIVVELKYMYQICVSNSTVNIWCAQTINPISNIIINIYSNINYS